ncbi:MAG TPA: substrate-binding domain-containing protein, partial [Lacunisphaera sp.]|nr:substrate-binding domain-containing protein [Lacunisphaera sp.]
YKYAHAQAGLAIKPELVRFGNYKQESGQSLAHELLSLSDPPTALFVCNGLMTAGALEAIAAHGLKIPKQVAIVGFDDLPLADVFNPPLTVVRQPAYEVGKYAAELLLKRIEDAKRPATSLKLMPELIIRNSC